MDKFNLNYNAKVKKKETLPTSGLIVFFFIKEEFIKGLVAIAQFKLDLDMISLLNAPEIFYHTINEILSFQRNLKEFHDFPPRGLTYKGSCIETITENKAAFELWLQLEKQCEKRILTIFAEFCFLF